MAFKLIRKTVKSQSYSMAVTGGAGAAFQVPMQFLEPALSGMKNPVIKRLRARVVHAVDIGASTGPARMFPQVFSRVQLSDGAGIRVSLTGANLRLANILERGGSYRDGLNLAAGAGQSAEMWIDLLPCDVLAEQGENDHGILVSDLLNGGELILTWVSSLTPYAGFITWLTTTTVEIYADVFEGYTASGEIVLPPRHVWQDETVSQTDYRMKVGGLLRQWGIYIGAATEDNLAGFSAQNYYSEDLKIPGFPLGFFKDTYKETRDRTYDGDAAAVTAIEDPFLRTSPQAVLIFGPERGQPIGDLPLIESAQFKTDGAIGSDSPQMIKCFYTQRSGQLEQAALGAPSTQAAAALIRARGTISDTGKPVGALKDAGLARFLPVRVKVAA